MKFVISGNMGKLFAVMAFLLCGNLIQAQVNKGARFNETTHDFGSVKEEIGKVSTIFSFVNISDKPIYIVKVETSCGCTTPKYSTSEIKPGDTGFITAIYETMGRKGDFYKNLFVHFNNESYYQSLAIKGYVIPMADMQKKPQEYATTYANLAFTETVAHFNPILNSEKKTVKIKVYNYNGYDIRILEIKELPDFLKMDIKDSVLRTDDSMTITFYADGSKIKQFGDQFTRIALKTDDNSSEIKYLHVHTNLKEDFSKWSKKKLKSAPKFTTDKDKLINFGKKQAGSKFSHVIKITNTGLTDLMIHKLVPSCSCITFALSKLVLKPGETVSLVITVDTINQSIAEHTKYLTLITNDPSQPEVKIKMIMDIT